MDLGALSCALKNGKNGYITCILPRKEKKEERNGLLRHEKSWRKSKCRLLSEGSQSAKAPKLRLQRYDVREKGKLWRPGNVSGWETGGGGGVGWVNWVQHWACLGP